MSLQLSPHLQAGLLSVLHETEIGGLSRGGAIHELSALLRFLKPSLPETLAAVAQAEARLDVANVPVLEQCEWLATLRCLPHLTAPRGPHTAEQYINEVRPFLAKGSSPLACAVACSLLPQWAANLDASSAHWLQQLKIICQNLRTVQQQAPTESAARTGYVPGTHPGYGYAYAALKVASVNAQAAVLLHWAASSEWSESSQSAAAAAAGAGAGEERPAFVETVVNGLIAQLAQLSSEAAGRDHPAVGLAAAVGLGQLLQRLQGRKALQALQQLRPLATPLSDAPQRRPSALRLMPLQDAVARAMVGVVTAGARRAALDDADESGAAAATVACLLGLAGAPSLGSACNPLPWRLQPHVSMA